MSKIEKNINKIFKHTIFKNQNINLGLEELKIIDDLIKKDKSAYDILYMNLCMLYKNIDKYYINPNNYVYLKRLFDEYDIKYKKELLKSIPIRSEPGKIFFPVIPNNDSDYFAIYRFDINSDINYKHDININDNFTRIKCIIDRILDEKYSIFEIFTTDTISVQKYRYLELLYDDIPIEGRSYELPLAIGYLSYIFNKPLLYNISASGIVEDNGQIIVPNFITVKTKNIIQEIFSIKQFITGNSDNIISDSCTTITSIEELIKILFKNEINKYQSKNPGNAVRYFIKAENLSNQNCQDFAEYYYDRFIDLVKNRESQFKYELGQTYLKLLQIKLDFGQAEKTGKMIKKIHDFADNNIISYPDYIRTKIHKSTKLIDEYMFQDAIGNCYDLLKDEKYMTEYNKVEISGTLAQAYTCLGNIKKATEYIDKTIETAPVKDKGRDYIYKSDIFYQSGQYKKALTILNKIKKDGYLTDAATEIFWYYKTIRIYYYLEDYQNVKKQYKSFLKNKTRYPFEWVKLFIEGYTILAEYNDATQLKNKIELLIKKIDDTQNSNMISAVSSIFLILAKIHKIKNNLDFEIDFDSIIKKINQYKHLKNYLKPNINELITNKNLQNNIQQLTNLTKKIRF